VVKIRTLNVGSMTGRGHELVDLMERRKVKIMCLQETRWKGSKARELGNGFKLFYVGEDGKRNGVGIVLNDDLKKGVLEMRRPSDRIILLKVEMGQQVVNIMSAYAPQSGCADEEKEKFWGDLDEEMRKIPDGEKLWIGGDFNGCVGSDNTGIEATVGKYGYGERNGGGEAIVDFAVSHDLWIVNTFYKKAPRHRITYQNGGAETQIDYILCCSDDRNTRDCKVILGEAITNQHRPVICTIQASKLKAQKKTGTMKTKWWKLNTADCRTNFSEKAKEKLERRRLEDRCNWETIASDMRILGEEVLGKTSGKVKVGKETWWWGEEVQKCIRDKKEAKKRLFEDNTDENRTNYKRAKKQAKKVVAVAKAKAYNKLFEDLETTEGTKKVLRIAKQRDKNSKDIYQTRQIKSEDGDVLVKDEEIMKRWHTYFTRLMNEENPREAQEDVQEDNLDEMEAIMEAQAKSALKKMKNGKAVGPDNLPIEVWKCLGEEGITFLCEILNKICEEEHIPEAWRKSTLIPIYKNKGDIMSCGNYRGIKLISHSMKLYERTIEGRLR